MRIEDYALIGDTETAALVSRHGSIDWLCLPRFDSGACFASLLGDEHNGRWSLAPAGEVASVRRRYRPDTLMLETRMETAEGSVSVLDFMPIRGKWPDVVRIARGLSGSVAMRSRLRLRFDYGSATPWLRIEDGEALALAGPDAVRVQLPFEMRVEDHELAGEFTLREGDEVAFVMTWFPSSQRPSRRLEPAHEEQETERWWRSWAEKCSYEGPYRDPLVRSLCVLKALTYGPTGGIVAAPTTSLPEKIGADRNWDYRFCWIRDATFTLYALLGAGYEREAAAWRDWLLRAAAGDPDELQILYGVAGERRLVELELPWLAGYQGSRPVRIGNGAVEQLQLDVYGELMDAMHRAREVGMHPVGPAWELQRGLLDSLERRWQRPDAGIWEIRSEPRHFTHSKVMAWVALERGIYGVDRWRLGGDADRWRRLAEEIRGEILERGYDRERGVFVQSYGSAALDASLLRLPLVGFLPPDDERIVRTVDAIASELDHGGFVLRYRQDGGAADGLSSGENVFLPCSFWLADCYALMGRRREAKLLLERLLGLANDVGLLSEEYDPAEGRMLGNFPQALTHVGLVNSVLNLTGAGGPAHERSGHARSRQSDSPAHS